MITVYKLGGSLLDMPDLCSRLSAVMAQRPDSQPLILVGGGTTADLVRTWDAVHRLDNTTAHWLAIEAMGLNERLLAAILPESVLVKQRDDAAAAWRDNRIPVIHAAAFLRMEERCVKEEDLLPRSWGVTSDSIAAWIATRWPAEELVLMKSCEAPMNVSSATGAAIDSSFAQTARGNLNLGWVNLRVENPMVLPWR